MSVADINVAGDVSDCQHYDLHVARWEPGARGRLEEAAFGLYAERGFERTTVAEIAQRAGLTERTFFRHFADKREVLFARRRRAAGRARGRGRAGARLAGRDRRRG